MKTASGHHEYTVKSIACTKLQTTHSLLVYYIIKFTNGSVHNFHHVHSANSTRGPAQISQNPHMGCSKMFIIVMLQSLHVDTSKPATGTLVTWISIKKEILDMRLLLKQSKNCHDTKLQYTDRGSELNRQDRCAVDFTLK
jgi:hypothetical protein